MSFKDVISKFTDSVKDVTSLQITTYTGTLEQVVNAQTGQIQWDQFKPTAGKLVLVAATMIQPGMLRPRISISRTWGLRSARAPSSGSMRTSRPPLPEAATHMLPFSRKAKPPNMRCSVIPCSSAKSSRILCARSSS